MVNGAPGVLVEIKRKRIGVMGCTVNDGRLTAIDLVLEPLRYAAPGSTRPLS